MMLALLATVALAQSAAYYTPSEAQNLFDQANAAYGKEDFTAARDGFQKLLTHGYGGADVRFNLGTTYLAEGDLGHAILELERARKEEGTRPDLDANLALARSRQLDQVVGAQTEDPLLQRVVAATGESTVTAGFLVAWVGLFTLLIARRFVRSSLRGALTFAAGVLLLFAIPTGLLVAMHAVARDSLREAVVLAPSLAARDAPQPTAKATFEVHAGLKVRLLDDAGAFVRIRLPNGLEGWTDRESLGLI